MKPEDSPAIPAFAGRYNLPDNFRQNGVFEFHEGKEHLSIRVDQFVLDYSS